MAINLEEKSAGSRETRLGSISGYSGDLDDLVKQSCCGSLKNKERCFSQTSSCNAGCALSMLSGIRNVAVINHAPVGCSSMGAGMEIFSEIFTAKRGLTSSTVFVGTDMNESDTVFGATGSLYDIALEVYKKYKPEAIFIGASCVTGIIAEDIDSIVEKLKAELPIPVAAVHCEGIKSRIWATGFDEADKAILTSIVKPPKEKRRVINFKNFFESARDEIIEIFSNFDVEPLFLPLNTTVEELSHISESLATVCICGTLGTYLGNALEKQYGVPYVRTINPLGVTGFETWLREIGRVIHKQTEVEAYIQREREKYIPELDKVKKELKGLRAILGMGPGYTFEVARVLNELGIEVVWGAAWHFDKQYDDGKIPPSMSYLSEQKINFKLSVADQQNYEIMNILNTYKPDIYLSRHPGTTVWAIKQGFPALCVTDEYMIFGYKHTLEFAYTLLDTIKNRSFEKNLVSRIKLPYTDWWYKQNSDLFLKELI